MTTFPQSHLRQLILSSDTYILIVSYSMRADGRGRLSTLRKVVLTYYSYVPGTTYVIFWWLAVGSCRKPNRSKAITAGSSQVKAREPGGCGREDERGKGTGR